MAATNYYDDLISRLIGDGVPLPAVIERVAGAYLDGKPLASGKKKLTKKERDGLFWSSDVVKCCPPDAWGAEAMSLARAPSRHAAAAGWLAHVSRLDPHSPAEFRCNQVVRNLDGFHEAFAVQPADALWLDPADRVRIW